MNDIRKSFYYLLKAESDLANESAGSVKDYLEGQGLDYGKIATKGSELARKLLLKAKAEKIRQAQEDLISHAKQMLASVESMGNNGLDKLQELFQKQFGNRYALNFRNLKEMDETEAIKILSDIQILEFIESNKPLPE